MATGGRLLRETFRTSRLAEFASVKELTAQTGHNVSDWPLVVGKELVDNAIDIAEEAGIAPVIDIKVSTDTGEIVVTDNGPGIATEVIDAILDFSVRVSSREAYVSPTRGAQGNALKCLVAMPFVLDPDIGETVIIESRGVAHRIRFEVDPVKREPRISFDRGMSTVRNGARITVRWPVNASLILDDAGPRFLPLAWNFVALNPHLALTFVCGGHTINAEAMRPGWQKWRPSDPIPARWYNPDRLQRYIAACVNDDREHGRRVRSVRDFIGSFRGLSGTAKRSAVLAECDLFRAPLDVFFRDDQVDRAGIARLLGAMQGHSRPVKPEALGLIGEDHFRNVFAADGADEERFNYCRMLGEQRGLPYVVEAAFAPAAKRSATPVVSGINWSSAIGEVVSRRVV